jgi:protein FRG1
MVFILKSYKYFRHGGWWAAKEFRHISGPIAIELGDNSYIRALDDGTFTVGAPHNDGKLV